jgi:hypothetical protein
MRHAKIWVAAGMMAFAATGLNAQQTPRRATNVVPPPAANADGTVAPAFTVALTVKGANAEKFLTVTAKDADVRALFREMGAKSATPVLVADSATGKVTVNLTDKPLTEAMQAVATAANLPLRLITVPEASVASLTPESAGRVSDALTALPVSAGVTDPATGKTLIVEASNTGGAKGRTTVYFLKGKYSTAQEEALKNRVAAEATEAPANNAISNAVQSINQLPVQQRMEAMREMNRQMWSGMSDSDRQAMRDQMRQGRRGRRGGGQQ